MTSFDNLPIDEIPIRGLVKRFVAKWRHQSRYRPAKHDSLLHLGSVRGHRLVRDRSWPDKEGAGMMSSMHKNTVAFAVLLASAGTVAAALKTSGPANPLPAAVQSAPAAAAVQTQRAVPPAPAIGSRVSTGLARWNSLRQSDRLPFTSSASFLTSYRGWPGRSEEHTV